MGWPKHFSRVQGVSTPLPGSPAQCGFDLAIDTLELSREILDQHAQAPFLAIDDLPQLGALGLRKSLVGEPDTGTHDVAPPALGAPTDEVNWQVLRQVLRQVFRQVWR